MAFKLTKIMRSEMSAQQIADYNRRGEISEQTHAKLQEIYAKYNPEINALKAKKKAEMDALYQWRDEVYEAENLNG